MKRQLRVSRLSLTLVLVFALAVAGSIWLVCRYGAEDFLVQLASGFLAALAAFVLALTWERDRERRQAEARAKRVTDVEQTLGPHVAVHPQLLDRAWTASAPSLAELVADYRLTADIARTYGRIEELRWRLRTRTQLSLQGGLEGMISALVAELITETKELVERIDAEIANPSVRFGVVHALQGTIAARATIEATLIRADEESS